MPRPLPQAVLDMLERRQTIIAVPMLWIEAKRRDNGRVQGIGLWRGEGSQKIVVTDLFTGLAAARDFHAGGLLEIGPVRFEQGLNVRPIPVRLSAISDAVLIAFREYDARGAKVQAWRRFYDPETRLPVAAPVRWFKGYVNKAPSERPAPGGEAAMSVEVVSTARHLTNASGLKKSHAAQQRREGDMIRQYKGTAREWPVLWGQAEVDRD